MNYIVLDLEWNQAKSKKQLVRKPVILHGEIIQIGAVKLDPDFQTVDTFRSMVAPAHYTTMQKYVERLTGISNEDIAAGKPFEEVFRRFQQWCGEDFSFLTWGKEDERILRTNLRLYGYPEAWMPKTLDVERIFNAQFVRAKNQTALSKAVEQVGETPLTAHDALHDAINTVLVLNHLEKQEILRVLR